MRVRKPYMILTFSTTTQAMAMEQTCQVRGISGRLIPVPREITAGCGLAWRIPLEDYEREKDRIDKLDVLFEQITVLNL